MGQIIELTQKASEAIGTIDPSSAAPNFVQTLRNKAIEYFKANKSQAITKLTLDALGNPSNVGLPIKPSLFISTQNGYELAMSELVHEAVQVASEWNNKGGRVDHLNDLNYKYFSIGLAAQHLQQIAKEDPNVTDLHIVRESQKLIDAITKDAEKPTAHTETRGDNFQDIFPYLKEGAEVVSMDQTDAEMAIRKLMDASRAPLTDYFKTQIKTILNAAVIPLGSEALTANKVIVQNILEKTSRCDEKDRGVLIGSLGVLSSLLPNSKQTDNPVSDRKIPLDPRGAVRGEDYFVGARKGLKEFFQGGGLATNAINSIRKIARMPLFLLPELKTIRSGTEPEEHHSRREDFSRALFSFADTLEKIGAISTVSIKRTPFQEAVEAHLNLVETHVRMSADLIGILAQPRDVDVSTVATNAIFPTTKRLAAELPTNIESFI